MRRFLLLLFISMLLALALCACAAGSPLPPATAQPTAPTAAAPTAVTPTAVTPTAVAPIAVATPSAPAARQPSSTAASSSAAPSPSPSLARAENFFAGEWAGFISYFASAWTGFSEPMSDVTSAKCALLKFESAAGVFGASLGDSYWSVSACDETGFTLTCERAAKNGPPYFEKGHRLAFTYIENALAAPADMPSQSILLGKCVSPDERVNGVSLVFSRLVPSTQREAGDESYPRWFGGYENMRGEFYGIFCLGKNANGLSIFATVLNEANGAYSVLTDITYASDDRFSCYGPRDARMEDLTRLCAVSGVSDVFFPIFWRLENGRWVDVTTEHKDYFQSDYIPAMEAEIAAHSAFTGDIFELRRQLVRQGFIDYASKLVSGEFDGERKKFAQFIPQLVGLDKSYMPTASLAGIYPGDCVADARRLYSLHTPSAQEFAKFGLEGFTPGKLAYYTDGEGLLLSAFRAGDAQRVLSVTIIAPGYQTPDARQPGDSFDLSNRLLDAKNASIQYGNQVDFEGRIDYIKLLCVLDRVFDEAEIDMDGDGEKEYLTLSGRVLGAYMEQGTVFGDSDKGTVEPDDFGTRARLSVYKNGELLIEDELPLYIFGLRPQFSAMQRNKSGEAFILCDTGGSGIEQPIYSVKLENGKLKTVFLGFKTIH